MDFYHTTDVYGISLLNPDEAALRTLLQQLDDPAIDEAEHPDISLVHDASGWSVSAYPSGVVTMENLDSRDTPPLYMKGKSRTDVLGLWRKLARGEIEAIQKENWQQDLP